MKFIRMVVPTGGGNEGEQFPYWYIIIPVILAILFIIILAIALYCVSIAYFYAHTRARILVHTHILILVFSYLYYQTLVPQLGFFKRRQKAKKKEQEEMDPYEDEYNPNDDETKDTKAADQFSPLLAPFLFLFMLVLVKFFFPSSNHLFMFQN